MGSVVGTRNAARRVVLELAVIGVVLVAGAGLPLHDVPGTSWAFFTPLVLFLAHTVLGLLVLVDAVRIATSSRALGAGPLALAVGGLVVCLLAVGAGAASLADVGADDVRPAMVGGWLGGLVLYASMWVAASAALRSAGSPGPRHGAPDA
jgi:hypothetical protein